MRSRLIKDDSGKVVTLLVFLLGAAANLVIVFPQIQSDPNWAKDNRHWIWAINAAVLSYVVALILRHFDTRSLEKEIQDLKNPPKPSGDFVPPNTVTTHSAAPRKLDGLAIRSHPMPPDDPDRPIDAEENRHRTLTFRQLEAAGFTEPQLAALWSMYDSLRSPRTEKAESTTERVG